ncbi:hypothetical protein LXA47_17735, partial [Massilia sp. P8910]|uniref:DUF3592 domain-containing protein n=1 Tax=Massilia antarctica TaxID=2765360 RepID=UPI001E3FD56E
MDTIFLLKYISLALGLAGCSLASYRLKHGSFGRSSAFIFVAAAMLLVMGFFLPQIMLAKVGRETPGVVVAVDCEQGKKHHIHFRFAVGTIEFNSMTAGSESANCEKLTLGTFGTVTYLPSDPTVHVWGSIWTYLGERIAGTLFVLALISFILYKAVSKRRRDEV